LQKRKYFKQAYSILIVLTSCLNEKTAVLGNEPAENKRSDCGQLDQDVDRRATSVFEWITHCIGDDSCLVLLRRISILVLLLEE